MAAASAEGAASAASVTIQASLRMLGAPSIGDPSDRLAMVGNVWAPTSLPGLNLLTANEGIAGKRMQIGHNTCDRKFPVIHQGSLIEFFVEDKRPFSCTLGRRSRELLGLPLAKFFNLKERSME